MLRAIAPGPRPPLAQWSGLWSPRSPGEGRGQHPIAVCAQSLAEEGSSLPTADHCWSCHPGGGRHGAQVRLLGEGEGAGQAPLQGSQPWSLPPRPLALLSALGRDASYTCSIGVLGPRLQLTAVSRHSGLSEWNSIHVTHKCNIGFVTLRKGSCWSLSVESWEADCKFLTSCEPSSSRSIRPGRESSP